MTYQVLHGDNLALLPALADNSIDAVVTDPPYGLSTHGEADVVACLQAWIGGQAYAHSKKGFMAAAWDGWVPSPTVWRECWRVLKPGGHLLCFAGSRTSDLMGISLRLAGFEVRDQIVWVYGSGFPKSHNVAKALDKANGKPSKEKEFTTWMRTAGLKSKDIDLITGTNMGGHYLTLASQPAIPTRAIFEQLRPHIAIEIPAWIEELIDRVEAEREVIGQDTKARAVGSTSALPTLGAALEYQTWDITLPATDVAQQWQGWGSALKPAFEPIWVCRKPLSERTLAANVLKWGVGAINVDATRVGTSSTPRKDPRNGKLTNAHLEMRPWMKERIENGEPLKGDFDGQQGRWPANLVHDGSAEVLARFPVTTQASWRKAQPDRAYPDAIFPQPEKDRGERGHNDTGSAARFFYCAKASKRDRDEGLEGWEGKMQLRADLTTEQRAYVMAELKRCGVNL
jgi:hypothetical protein